MLISHKIDPSNLVCYESIMPLSTTCVLKLLYIIPLSANCFTTYIYLYSYVWLVQEEMDTERYDHAINDALEAMTNVMAQPTQATKISEK